MNKTAWEKTESTQRVNFVERASDGPEETQRIELTAQTEDLVNNYTQESQTPHDIGRVS